MASTLYRRRRIGPIDEGEMSTRKPEPTEWRRHHHASRTACWAVAALLVCVAVAGLEAGLGGASLLGVLAALACPIGMLLLVRAGARATRKRSAPAGTPPPSATDTTDA
jgi:hypothetical protein